MRVILAALAMLIVGSLAQPAAAYDPYKWCANYSGGGTGGGATNCYFLTLEQCNAQISGMGGFCEPNQFYTGPDRAAAASTRRSAKRK